MIAGIGAAIQAIGDDQGRQILLSHIRIHSDVFGIGYTGAYTRLAGTRDLSSAGGVAILNIPPCMAGDAICVVVRQHIAGRLVYWPIREGPLRCLITFSTDGSIYLSDKSLQLIWIHTSILR